MPIRPERHPDQLTFQEPIMTPLPIPAGYYAVPDPTSAEPSMTYWHVAEGDDPAITAWPPKARYGPVLLRRDMPKGHAARVATYQAFSVRRAAFATQIRTAISQDPASAAAEFASFSTRCMVCGRALKDPRSKVLGIGPDCRRHSGLNDRVLLAMAVPAVAAAHAVHSAQRVGAAA